MAREKFTVGEVVEMRCHHRRAGQVVVDWLPGEVVHADARMVAVRLEGEVYSNNGWLIHDCTLWCTHGSPNLRRATPPHPRAPSAGDKEQGRQPGEGESTVS